MGGLVFAVLVAAAAAATGLSERDRDFVAYAASHFRDAERPAIAEGYRYSGDAYRELAAAIAAHPGVVEPEVIGTSLGERPIWAFHVVAPGAVVERDVLVFAGIHALEWISTEVATDLLLELIDAPAVGVRVTVVPLLNVDGRVRVQRDLDAGRNRYRRGNRAGVDLNRDFAVNREVEPVWAGVIPAYYATSPGPLSQPESRAIAELADREGYDRSASLHAFGGFFYTPWSGRFSRPEDHAEHHRLGREMEAAQGAHPYRTRQLSRWGFFFRARGSELDHMYGEAGATSFLVELTRSGMEPFHPWTWKNYFRRYNPADPRPHEARGLEAMRALITSP
jgi:hypothetical protein